MTPKDFFDFAKKHNAKMVDLKFVDLLGTWMKGFLKTDWVLMVLPSGDGREFIRVI
jgi:glutamine synthetase